MTQPNFCVLKATGINCEAESARAVRLAGGGAEIIHSSQLESGDRRLQDYQGLFIPGGFSEGDAVSAGAVLAVELRQRLGDDIRTFVDAGKPVLGICNGFQVLVKMGLLPGDGPDMLQTASLAPNVSGQFESRWVDLYLAEASSPFVPEVIKKSRIALPIANGEGRFMADQATLDRLQQTGRVLLYYCDPETNAPSMDPAHNPSGSSAGIAAICNPAGNVMGAMPHVERNALQSHDINHRRATAITPPPGLTIMRSIVDYAANV